jgi:hypothetical protein
MKKLKHIELFESFSDSGSNESETIVIGVVSEGIDVGAFTKSKGMELWNHLSSIQSDYYFPFMFDVSKLGLKSALGLYVVVDADGVFSTAAITNMTNDYLAKDDNLLVYLIDENGLKKLKEGPIKNISFYYLENGEIKLENKSFHGSMEFYVVPIIGGDKYMEFQSWGQEIKDSAYENFMKYQSDEE